MTLRRLLACGAAAWLAFIVRSVFRVDGVLYSSLFDDAMISMRYARNFADGHGLVWNAGSPAVQGYTNPLWTFLMAAVHLAGVPPRLASLAVMLIGFAILAGITVSTYRLARTVSDDDGVAGGAAALAVFGFPLVFWTLRGMEVGLLAWMVTEAACRLLRYARDGERRELIVAAAALAVALWTRTDAVVPAVVLWSYVILARPAAWRTLTAAAAALAVVGFVGPLAFGWWYYGSALPNTYYLKLDGAGPARRVLRGLPALGLTIVRSLLGALIPILALAAVPFRGRRARELSLLGVLVAGQCAYSVFVGGDAWEWMGFANRYVAIALPALAVLTAEGVAAALTRDRFMRLLPLAFAVAVALHVGVLLFLLSTNRGIETEAVSAFNAYPAPVTFGLAAVGFGIVASATLLCARRTMASVTLAVWMLTSGVPAGRWAIENAPEMRQDERAARLGLLIRETLAPEATYAVARAGAVSYFGGHAVVDLLGKSDPVIARMAPAIPEFVPGHNKWNLEYSIGRLQPDLACDLPRRSGDMEYLAREGYHPVGGTCFARAGARLDERRLREGIAAIGAGREVAR